MIDRQTFDFTATVWTWQFANRSTVANWYFVTVEGQTALEIRLASLGLTAGFGSVRIRATIGTTTWGTSIFPHKESGGWMLPIKAEVRKREGIGAEDMVDVLLEFYTRTVRSDGQRLPQSA